MIAQPIEILGMLATTLILIALLHNNTKYLRLFNLAGSILFVIYGLTINAMSVWVLNGACAVVNIYKLIKYK